MEDPICNWGAVGWKGSHQLLLKPKAAREGLDFKDPRNWASSEDQENNLCDVTIYVLEVGSGGGFGGVRSKWRFTWFIFVKVDGLSTTWNVIEFHGSWLLRALVSYICVVKCFSYLFISKYEFEVKYHMYYVLCMPFGTHWSFNSFFQICFP